MNPPRSPTEKRDPRFVAIALAVVALVLFLLLATR